MSALAEEIQTAVNQATEPLRAQVAELAALLRASIKGNEAPFLTVHEVAEILSCSEKTVRRNYCQGQYNIKRSGGKILIPRAALL
ncbi:MAG: helix-turn-helix domain-containing protein [Rhodobacteraceae bacterium]|nr:helix-turn-helix domain-containing protein [Paracoccaceae bacterium]